MESSYLKSLRSSSHFHSLWVTRHVCVFKIIRNLWWFQVRCVFSWNCVLINSLLIDKEFKWRWFVFLILTFIIISLTEKNMLNCLIIIVFFRLKRTFPLTTRNPGNGNPTVQFANAVQNLAHSRFTQQRRQSFPRKRLYSDGILFTTFLSLMFMIQIQGKYQI